MSQTLNINFFFREYPNDLCSHVTQLALPFSVHFVFSSSVFYFSSYSWKLSCFRKSCVSGWNSPSPLLCSKGHKPLPLTLPLPFLSYIVPANSFPLFLFGIAQRVCVAGFPPASAISWEGLSLSCSGFWSRPLLKTFRTDTLHNALTLSWVNFLQSLRILPYTS